MPTANRTILPAPGLSSVQRVCWPHAKHPADYASLLGHGFLCDFWQAKASPLWKTRILSVMSAALLRWSTCWDQ